MTKWIATPRAHDLLEWISSACPASRAEIGRAVGACGHMVLLTIASDDDAAAIEAFLARPAPEPEPTPIEAPQATAAPPPAIPADPSGLFRGTKARLSFYSRNTVSWLAARSWGNASKKEDVRTLKAAKAKLDPAMIEAAAADLATVMERQLGRDSPNVCVTHVACGHSQRPDCFACRVAQVVAERLGFRFAKVFRDRFVKGSSHPKEFRKLPPIEIEALPAEPIVVVTDDVATSGWHMEEALTTLRSTGVIATGIVWISGNVD